MGGSSRPRRKHPIHDAQAPFKTKFCCSCEAVPPSLLAAACSNASPLAPSPGCPCTMSEPLINSPPTHGGRAYPPQCIAAMVRTTCRISRGRAATLESRAKTTPTISNGGRDGNDYAKRSRGRSKACARIPQATVPNATRARRRAIRVSLRSRCISRNTSPCLGPG